jgi:dipeptidyl aminopeptidase/acylaminoacyl peptidase
MIRTGLSFCLLGLLGGWMLWGCAGGPAARHAEKFGEPRDVAFTARDGSTQYYVQMLPESFNPRRVHDLLIALHGQGSDRTQFATNPRDECRGARDAALAHDMIFISPDYRAPASWMAPAAEEDLRQIIGELRAKYKVGKIILIGGSMGGTGALIFTIRHPELVGGVVSENGMANMLEYGNFQDIIGRAYGASKKENPEIYRERSAEFYPERFTMPVAFTTGGQDTVVPPQSVLRLAEAIKKHNPRVQVIHRPQTGHSTNYEDTRAALEFVLGR